jgi:hypothetical protein
MTVNDYERQGGFREELRIMREIGQRITTLQDKIPARPNRGTELNAVEELHRQHLKLLHEINTTRNLS